MQINAVNMNFCVREIRRFHQKLLVGKFLKNRGIFREILLGFGVGIWQQPIASRIPRFWSALLTQNRQNFSQWQILWSLYQIGAKSQEKPENFPEKGLAIVGNRLARKIDRKMTRQTPFFNWFFWKWKKRKMSFGISKIEFGMEKKNFWNFDVKIYLVRVRMSLVFFKVPNWEIKNRISWLNE
jgi:hypothetical protein